MLSKEEVKKKYDLVVGLEIHLQLNTKSKVFSQEEVSFAESPNSTISPITLAYPGTLPLINKKVIDYAMRLGLSVGSSIERFQAFARKNYFYPDLPKGYQISQFKYPICIGGEVLVRDKDQEDFIVGLERIHIEEDAGKNIHDLDPFFTLVDLNRAGIPLLEIVTKPVIYRSSDAVLFLKTIRNLVRYLKISDGNMEEGSMRCDTNISVKLKGSKELGQRVEIKNMNSFKSIISAIEYEYLRQANELETGGKIFQETRNYDQQTNETFILRTKENAHDYRYFPEPDILPIEITQEWVKAVKEEMPPMLNDLYNKYLNQLNLSNYDIELILSDGDNILFFEECLLYSKNYKAIANWLNVQIRGYLNSIGKSLNDFNLKPKQICQIIELIDNGKLVNSVATQKLLPEWEKQSTKKIGDICNELNILKDISVKQIEEEVENVLNKFADKVIEYKNGKSGLLSLFVGETMKSFKGKADPKLINQIILEKLK